MRPRRLLFTCEHGGNRIPARYASYFRGHRRSLASHVGFDPGALDLARRLARRFDAPLHFATVSRLLVDLNRSIGHPRLFSACVARLGEDEKQRIVGRYYLPYRTAIEERIRRWTRAGQAVLHVAVHSYVPRLNGVVRRAEVAFLYDPQRRGELRFARAWAEGLRAEEPALRIRFNYPYRGTSDGLTTSLRRCFGDAQYWGIELEVNQRRLVGAPAERRVLERAIAAGLASALGKQS